MQVPDGIIVLSLRNIFLRTPSDPSIDFCFIFLTESEFEGAAILVSRIEKSNTVPNLVARTLSAVVFGYCGGFHWCHAFQLATALIPE